MRYIEVVLKQSDNDHEGNGGQQLHNTVHDQVDLAAVVAFDGASGGGRGACCRGVSGGG